MSASMNSFGSGHAAKLAGHPAFSELFSATVQSVDEGGVALEATTLLDGYMNDELYLKLNHPVELNNKLFIVLRLLSTVSHRLPAVRLAIHGTVNHVELLPSGKYDLSVAIVDCQPL